MTKAGRDEAAPPGKPPALDPRLNAYRADLAAERLRHKIAAPSYAPGKTCQVVRPAVALRREPEVTAALDTEALLGEIVTVYDEADGWAWAQLERDRYVGYLPADALSPRIVATTHRVKAIGTYVFPLPDIKSPPLMHLSINCLVAVADGDAKLTRLEQGGYVPTRHLVERERFARDFVEVAERFIGTPYLWGGRTRLGLDCSGLVQVSLEAAGLDCPRDTDMQVAVLGIDVPIDTNLDGFQRGDLIFWPGHVGIMCDGLMLIHANAHHMSVTVETLPEAAQRVARTGGKLTRVKRLPMLGANSAWSAPIR